ncbi:MAG TPA: hypothetical protein VN201_00445, partial [Roseateles sp.]|nr:hypothetical protein [Roseateles sp.]
APSTLLTDAAAAVDGQGKPTEAPAAAPAEGAKPEGEEGKEKPAPTDADLHAPEEYEPFTIEGDAQLDGEFLEAFTPLAKELDLPQGKAQRLAELGAKEGQRLAGKFVTDLRDRVDSNAKAWETAVKADPELGGEHHDEVMGTAAKALKTFGTPELHSFLLESRLGSNPEMVRLLYRMGKAISQDGVTPGRATPGTKADADVFYGKS